MNKKVITCLILGMVVIFLLGCVENENDRTEEVISTPSLTSTVESAPRLELTPTPTPLPTPEPMITYDELLVAKGNDNPVLLVNHKNASEPTFDALIRFLKEDKTDERIYIPGSFVCSDIAEMLHNNAEAKGIKACFVTVTLTNYPIGHAINGFYTKDRGFVYVDCTASSLLDLYSGCLFADKLCYVEIGKNYTAVDLSILVFEDFAPENILTIYERECSIYNSEMYSWVYETEGYGGYRSAKVSYERDLEDYERDLSRYESGYPGMHPIDLDRFIASLRYMLFHLT
jgi:hypothetical protein